MEFKVRHLTLVDRAVDQATAFGQLNEPDFMELLLVPTLMHIPDPSLDWPVLLQHCPQRQIPVLVFRCRRAHSLTRNANIDRTN
jgi:hypothetical protein